MKFRVVELQQSNTTRYPVIHMTLSKLAEVFISPVFEACVYFRSQMSSETG